MRALTGKYFGRVAVGFISAAIFVWPTIGAESAESIPDLTGQWGREFFGLETPLSGPGPIANKSRLPTGQSNLRQLVGDYDNPILKPQAAEVLKRRGEISLAGGAFPQPSNQCGPQPTPYIFWQQEIQVLQQKNQIAILYMLDHHVRHVRLNGQHPARVTPTWSGDSVGHYEGDTLVIDTLGVKVGPLSMVDGLGTPQSDAVRVVERYRLIDYDAAIDSANRAEKEHIRVTSVPGTTGDGVDVDPNYKGKGLQLNFTVEDANVFTVPWSATITYRRPLGEWVEQVCAENTREYYGNKDTDVPRADKPDF